MMSVSVQVLEYRFDYFPAKIELAEVGRIVEIDAVERCWTEMAGGRGHSKFHFRVRCGSDMYQLSQDVGSGRWSIQPEAKGR